MYKIGAVAIGIFLLLVFMAGHCVGAQEQEPYRPDINLEEKTISGLLYRCPPWYSSVVIPDTFTHLDTVEGRGAWPFHSIVVVRNERDTIGFFRLK